MTPDAASLSGTGATPRPAATPSRAEHGLRVGLVLLVAIGLAVAGLLRPALPESGAGLTVAGQRLPEVCSLKRTTGVPCPGCGLTRSWVSAVHGDLGTSAAHHPLGWLVLLYALAQGARHATWLALPTRRGTVERVGGRLDRGVLVLGALLFLAWLPRVTALVLGS